MAEFHPNDSRHILLGGDGGVGESPTPAATTYDWLNTRSRRFYHVSYDMASPYLVCGGLRRKHLARVRAP